MSFAMPRGDQDVPLTERNRACRRLLLAVTALTALACSSDVPTRPTASLATTGIAPTADRQPAPPSSGVLDVCKRSSAGIPADQLFTFRLALSGVMRTVTVAAGSCVQLEVPREGAPLSKGHFRSTPAAVTRLLPGTATLRVDGADLSSADVQAILAAAPNVTVASGLLLNLAQQLIAADVNVLRGVQPSAQVLQAMADANAAIQIALGARIALTSVLPSPALGALVNTLTVFNEGKTNPAAVPLSVDLDVVEVVGSLVELTDIDCDPATRCSGVNLGAARVTATVASGATTVTTFTNRSKPVLRACKVAGPGIAAGRVFRLVASGINVTDAAILDVPAGECRDAVLSEASFMVTESGTLAGVAVSSITCDPASRCTDASPAIPVVTVAISRGITTVTFTNRSTLGVLRFCKGAGSGIATGRVFAMSASGINLVPKVGEPTTANLQVPAGECREATLLEGVYDGAEPNVPAGVAVASISCDPASRCSDVSLALGVLKARVVGATTTTVTITNRSTLGTLHLCKAAGPGITPGRVFEMTASGINLSGKPGEPTVASANVPAGECRDVTLLEGLYGVVESGSMVGVAVSAIACDPTARCSDVSLSVGSVKAQIVGASTTTVTFTNRSTLATLRVCKVAGPGVGVGTAFRFNATGINLSPALPEPTSASLDVPAGECREATVLEGLYDVVESALPSGVSVSAISCIPVQRCPDISVGVGDAKALMVGGSTTQVTFTNSASVSFNLSRGTAVDATALSQRRPHGRGRPEPNVLTSPGTARLRAE